MKKASSLCHMGGDWCAYIMMPLICSWIHVNFKSVIKVRMHVRTYLFISWIYEYVYLYQFEKLFCEYQITIERDNWKHELSIPTSSLIMWLLCHTKVTLKFYSGWFSRYSTYPHLFWNSSHEIGDHEYNIAWKYNRIFKNTFDFE